MEDKLQLSDAIQDGLHERDPDVSIRRVKDAVRRSLLSLDESPKIADTEYFNHTFAPDFVLHWNDSLIPDRFVYLKFADDPVYLAAEVKLVAEQHPLVIELDLEPDQTRNASSEATTGLQEVARANDTLITDPAGLEELQEEQTEHPILRLLGRALLQGGRGLLDRHAADETSRYLANGVDAAQRLQAEPTRQASELLNDLLSGQPQHRVQRFLQALWVGSGGSEATFPGRTDLTGLLDDDALAFLIETTGLAESIDFWRRIGGQLTVDQLARLPLSFGYYPNLQSLIESNIDRLWARVVKVISQPLQLPLEHAPPVNQIDPWWAVRNGVLCLLENTFETLIGTRSEQLEHVDITATEPSLQTLIERAHLNDIRLGELELRRQNRFLSYGSDDDNEDVTDDDELSEAALSLGAAASVRSAVANLAAGRHVKVHFSRATAKTEGPAKIPLRELVVTAIALLHDSETPDAVRVTDTLAEGPANPTLF
jgi:hypothetical protein